ncbi:MAG: hypothetical protein Q9218_003384, partial [Villophora microphyllina]
MKISFINGRGEPLEDVMSSSRNQSVASVENESLALRVFLTDSGTEILHSTSVSFNDKDREHPFALSGISVPSPAPVSVTLEVTRVITGKKFIGITDLYHLPIPESPQSIARVDSLKGGVLVKSDGSDWQTIFPYSSYLSGAWLASNPDNLKKFSDLGYNILHIVPGGAGIGYDLHQLDLWFDGAEKLGLWIMFDMRWTYQNNDYVRTQVERYKTRKNLLLWYTADEPDGHKDPPSAPSKAYAFIKSLDPYHPISLCLNCQNYYFESYSSGADIILADVYPIGTNLTYSNKYHTPCNETYGDCGCDNCDRNIDAVSNVPARLDTWSYYLTTLLPSTPKNNRHYKTFWAVPQAFPPQDFWQRAPTPKEIIAMTLLAINHGARGILGWQFPTTPEIQEITRLFALTVMETGTVKYFGGLGKFVLNGTPVYLKVEVGGEPES